ncbi:MAG: hypothetical protein EZS28_009952 [Streblomastix strix]|uniref:Uncharacterized protein n=1 Tax=Streblomastix strix TaxID=222440 RepID=A0A5J4WJM3_9EUKA|nr:MAG: hypothetical protein EZS28_009952 [Streblomastix strix]
MTVKQLVTALRTMERLNIFFGAEDYIGFCAGLKIGLSGSRYILAVIESNHTAEFFAPNQNYGDNYEEIATSILNYFNGAFTSASPNYIHFHTQQQQDTKQSKQPTQSIWDRLKERLQEGVRVGSSCLRWHLLIHKQKLYLVLFRKVLRQIEEVEDEDNEYWWDCEMIMDNLKIHNNFNRLNRNIENVTSNACNTALLNYFNDEQDEIFYSILMECPWIRKQIQIQRSTYHCYTQFVNLVQPMIDQNWAYQRGYNNNNRSKLRLQQFPSPNQIIFKLPIPSNTNNTTPYSPSYSSSNQSQSSYSSFNSSPSIDAYSSYKQQQSNVQQTALIMTSITSASSSQVPDGKKPEQMKAIKEALRFIQQTEVFRELNKNRIGMYSQIVHQRDIHLKE